MKKSILIITAIATCFIYSCKKDANNRISNVTYELDSVKMDLIDVNNSIAYSTILPISTNIIDSFQRYFNNFSSLDNTYDIYKHNDSIIYRNTRNINMHIPLFQNLILINNKPDMDSSINPLGGVIYTSNIIKYNYSISDKLDQIIINNKYAASYTIINTYNIYCKFNYSNNALISINKQHVNLNASNLDTINNYKNSYNFSYTNLQNQKDLIGIDLNDLFINALIYNISFQSATFPFADLFIVNSLMSYNTNSNKLIESIQFDRISNTGTFTVNISAQYTFDATKNNRVNTMKIITLFNGTESKILYTFYYKN